MHVHVCAHACVRVCVGAHLTRRAAATPKGWQCCTTAPSSRAIPARTLSLRRSRHRRRAWPSCCPSSCGSCRRRPSFLHPSMRRARCLTAFPMHGAALAHALLRRAGWPACAGLRALACVRWPTLADARRARRRQHKTAYCASHPVTHAMRWCASRGRTDAHCRMRCVALPDGMVQSWAPPRRLRFVASSENATETMQPITCNKQQQAAL